MGLNVIPKLEKKLTSAEVTNALGFTPAKNNVYFFGDLAKFTYNGLTGRAALNAARQTNARILLGFEDWRNDTENGITRIIIASDWTAFGLSPNYGVQQLNSSTLTWTS